jgi:dTDP-4-amino-4,6-dideoxygalactose transaminase
MAGPPFIPINDPLRLYRRLGAVLDEAIGAVVRSGRWIEGPATERFAAEFAAWCGVKHCVLVANGSDALELSMRALGLGPGDEVITVANAGGYTTNACRLVGANPVWIDVRPDTLTMDVAQIPQAVGPRTKLVVATHLYGMLVDVNAIRQVLKDRPDIAILEDCAQSHGAVLDGQRAGALGDMAAFSFYPTKNLGAFGDAGAVLTNNDSLAEFVGWLRHNGCDQRFRTAVPLGRNSRIDEIQAAVLSAKLPHVDGLNAERRAILARYADAMGARGTIVGAADATNVAHLAIARFRDRDAAVRAFTAAAIGTDIHYPVLDCDQVSDRGLPGRRLDLSVSEQACEEILTLPCYPGLSDEEVERVIQVFEHIQTPV